jgi:hypothetical protein
MKTYKRMCILPPQKVGAGACTHEVKVTRIGDGYNIRVFVNGTLNQESRVYDRAFISAEARDMLRWEDKLGNISKYADRARHRLKEL